MSASSSDSIMPGVLIVLVMLPVLYGIGRAGSALGNVRSAYLLAPLAPMIGGHVERSRRRLVGTYEGWPVQVFFEPQRSVGSSGNASSATSRMNAFSIAIPDLPGAADWRLQFHVTGTFGQGGRELGFGMVDESLRQRLEGAGALADVGAVSSPTLSYVTVQYEARTQTLTYTDDVSPSRVPNLARFAVHLALAARLAALNARVNVA
ncbi:MAG TPA: hypothetical protein VLI43_08810 [Gemmatimonadaceae bacterium]|nr:hypothetical protein [Gemmatimonadaceae bacterium]